jgi:hypothetical protein
MVVIFFVDDIIPMYHPDNNDKYEAFKLIFQTKYKMRDMGDLKKLETSVTSRDLENKKFSFVKTHLSKI